MRLVRPALVAALLLATAAAAPAQEAGAGSAGGAPVRVEAGPRVVTGEIPFSLTLSRPGAEPVGYAVRSADGRTLAEGSWTGEEPLELDELTVASGDALPLEIEVDGATLPFDRPFVPGWFSLLPPLIAIGLALVFREVVSALFAGVWLGALAVAGFNPVAAVWRTVDTFAVPALADVDGGHTQIIMFSLLLGGMVGLMARSGGTQGIVEKVAPLATSARRGQLATWLAGLAIFFDDYANTLLVGNTMRPITDRLKISREKLAYLVDSTAAPVAAIVPISTWVGYEISLIGDGLRIAADQSVSDPAMAQSLLDASPFAVFIHSIPYLFYPILALVFVFLVSSTGRDFGAMAEAEDRATSGGGLHRPGAQLATDTSGAIMEPADGAPHRWYNAALPVLTVIFVVLFGLYHSGRAAVGPDASLMDVFGAADPFSTLLWGSLAGCLVAVALALGQGILSLEEAIDAWLGGLRAMVIAMVILVLAWSLGAVTEVLGTAPYLARILSDTLPLELLPALVFVTAAAIAFATGTSWGTMAILIPLVVPLVVSLGGGVDFAGGTHYTVLLGSISSVLAGAIFGDHCSPISDTTVLSSMASACDHVDHVRTQLPYALLVAGVGITLGDIPTAYGVPNALSLAAGVVVLFVVLRVLGGRRPRPGPANGHANGPREGGGSS